MKVNPVGMILALALSVSLSAAQGRSGSAPPTPPQRPPQSNAPATPPGKPSTPPANKPATPPANATGQMNATQHLAQQPQLAAQLQKLYPEMDLTAASAEFKSLGLFVSAMHVSKNLTIPFDQLKAQITGESAVSLGAAIKELKPTVDADAEVKKADAQAKADQDRAKGGGK
jgi:hypothetical protein